MNPLLILLLLSIGFALGFITCGLLAASKDTREPKPFRNDEVQKAIGRLRKPTL